MPGDGCSLHKCQSQNALGQGLILILVCETLDVGVVEKKEAIL